MHASEAESVAVAPASRASPRPPQTRYALGGELGRRLKAVTAQWLLPAPFANPRLLEMFRERDLDPPTNQVPWAGEFAGKYLTCGTQILRLTDDPALRRQLAWFVAELAGLQADDGYLGPWPKAWRLKPGTPACDWPWDAWGHYHVMLGLLLWHDLTADPVAMACARRIADLLCRRFLTGTERLHDTGCHEMNQAPVHTLAMLYRQTGKLEYLALARRIVEEFALPPAGDYYRQGLADVPFYRTPKPRWESLHPILGLVELHYATGDATYRQAFENLWWSMLEGDRHNHGGFTSGERATGNPCDGGAIETCCTVAWSAMCVEMLQLTGSSVVADELELTLLNSGLGLISPSGRWVTYNTPMDGIREASAHSIVFQARAGSPELNCCSVNGPRLLGLVGEWALLAGDAGELRLNYYGPGRLETVLPSGRTLRLTQATQYPRKGRVTVTVELPESERFKLSLRIPYWSERTRVRVNGVPFGPPAAGSYLALDRVWQAGDRIVLDLDLRPHFWVNPHRALPPFEADWTVFGPAPRTADEQALNLPPQPVIEPTLETADRIPQTLTMNGAAFGAVTVRSAGGLLTASPALPALSPPPTYVAMTEWISEQEDLFELAFSADWWASWWINGRLLFSNFACGGNGGTLDSHAHRLTVPVRKGRNLLVLQLGAGSQRGGWVSLGRGPLQSQAAPAPSGPQVLTASVYRGPVLMAYDPALNGGNAALSAGLDAAHLDFEPGETLRTWLPPQQLLRTRNLDGQTVQLCDFASAGLSGSRYLTWLPVRFAAPVQSSFSRRNPLRSVRGVPRRQPE